MLMWWKWLLENPLSLPSLCKIPLPLRLQRKSAKAELQEKAKESDPPKMSHNKPIGYKRNLNLLLMKN